MIPKLFKVLGVRFENQTGGYTRMARIPNRENLDCAAMAVLEYKRNPFPPLFPVKHVSEQSLLNQLLKAYREEKAQMMSEKKDSWSLITVFVHYISCNTPVYIIKISLKFVLSVVYGLLMLSMSITFKINILFSKFLWLYIVYEFVWHMNKLSCNWSQTFFPHRFEVFCLHYNSNGQSEFLKIQIFHISQLMRLFLILDTLQNN